MAEALLRQHGHAEVRSAGVAADIGARASGGAIRVLQRRGIDLAGHRSQMISEELVEWADLILTMTRRHKEVVIERFPQAKDKTYTLKEFAVGEQDKLELMERLHALYQQVDEKRREFAASHTPNISQLQVRRAELLDELQAVEQKLAELQGQLRDRVQQERAEIERIEASLASPDVADPFGQDDEVYAQCADEIESLLIKAAKKLHNSPSMIE